MSWGLPRVRGVYTKRNRQGTENEEFLERELKSQVGEEEDSEEDAVNPR